MYSTQVLFYTEDNITAVNHVQYQNSTTTCTSSCFENISQQNIGYWKNLYWPTLQLNLN